MQQNLVGIDAAVMAVMYSLRIHMMHYRNHYVKTRHRAQSQLYIMHKNAAKEASHGYSQHAPKMSEVWLCGF